MSWTDPEFDAIAGLLTDEFGVAFPPARRAFAEAAIRRALGLAHEHSLTAYRERLTVEPELLRELIGEVTVGETYFFRDADQYDVIRATVLPDILSRRSDDSPLRIWSAGCATGEEPYSLAILLSECGLSRRVTLLATDVSNAAIATARRGQYGEWSFRRDVAGRRERCFAPSGKRWTIATEFRRVVFAVHNLMQPAPAIRISDGGFDLIVCRNVLLYFEPAMFARAMHLLHDALAPGGWLLMSPTDPPPPNDLGLESVLTPAGVVFRKLVPAAKEPPAHMPVPVLPVLPERSSARRVHVPPQRPVPLAQAEPRVAPASRRDDAESYAARALSFLDARQPHQAAACARRALYLDRSLAVAHLALARALRLTGNSAAAQRALRIGTALLEAYAPADAVPGAGGTSAGTLCAVAAAEFDLLVGSPS